MLMMTVYLAQQQQKQKLTSIQNMSVTVCNFVNMFDYLQVSVSVVVVPCETFSATAAANITTQSISECVADRAAKWCDVTISFNDCHYITPMHCPVLSFLMTLHHLPLNLCN